mmetsp:Transcript_39117/g.92671  ORF Transcript_39117/g.92671 Transcript_39117/m.92671 type:complete len:369 (+) Transcript_39117:448-1554(+)
MGHFSQTIKRRRIRRKEPTGQQRLPENLQETWWKGLALDFCSIGVIGISFCRCWCSAHRGVSRRPVRLQVVLFPRRDGALGPREPFPCQQSFPLHRGNLLPGVPRPLRQSQAGDGQPPGLRPRAPVALHRLPVGVVRGPRLGSLRGQHIPKCRGEHDAGPGVRLPRGGRDLPGHRHHPGDVHALLHVDARPEAARGPRAGVPAQGPLKAPPAPEEGLQADGLPAAELLPGPVVAEGGPKGPEEQGALQGRQPARVGDRPRHAEGRDSGRRSGHAAEPFGLGPGAGPCVRPRAEAQPGALVGEHVRSKRRVGGGLDLQQLLRGAAEGVRPRHDVGDGQAGHPEHQQGGPRHHPSRAPREAGRGGDRGAP